jgi:hypothetical protein
MKVFICIENGSINQIGFTSLLAACECVGVSYDSAARGKRVWVNDYNVKIIKEVEITKIKNRGRK